MTMRARVSKAVTALAVAGLALSGCGLQTASGGAPKAALGGPLRQYSGSLDGTDLSVGSKNFTEQLILGKMAVILMQAAGAKVQDLTNIPGSSSARQAMTQGDVNLAWEYTGTGWIAYLGHSDAIPDPAKQYRAVRDEDLARNNLVWLPPAPENNTYGFAVKASTANRLRISRLSQLASVPAAERTLCVESEFASRNDGLEPMLKKYGVPLGTGIQKSQVKTLDTGAIYAAVNNGICTFGEVFTTDGRIKALHLKVLDDDRSVFPNYNASVVVGKKVLQQHPDIARIFAPVSARLTDATLIDLNAKVDVDGQEPARVAMDWLRKEGFVTPT